jgi:hypothetical protein
MPCICVRPCVRAPTQRSALLPHVHAFGVGTLPPSFPAASPAGLHAHAMRQPLDICLRPLQNLCFHRPHAPLRAPSMPPPLAQPNTTNTTHTSPRFTLSFRACPRAWLRLMRCKWWSSGLGKREARNGEPSGTRNKEKRRRAAGTTPSSGSVVWGQWARVGVMALLARAGGPGDDAWRWVS